MSQPEVKSDFCDDSDFYDGYDVRREGEMGGDGDGHLVLGRVGCSYNSQSYRFTGDVQVAIRRELSQQTALTLLLKIAVIVGDHGLKSVQEAIDRLKINQVLAALDREL